MRVDPFEKWMEKMAREMAKEILFPRNEERPRDEHLKYPNSIDYFIAEDEDEESR